MTKIVAPKNNAEAADRHVTMEAGAAASATSSAPVEGALRATTVDLLASLRAQATAGKYVLADDRAFFRSGDDGKDCAVRLRQLIERAVIRRAVTDILAQQAEDGPAYCLSVYDGEETVVVASRDFDKIMEAIMSTDEDLLLVRRQHADRASTFVGEIHLVYGNDGWDVIADHSVSITSLLVGADALADSLGDLL